MLKKFSIYLIALIPLSLIAGPLIGEINLFLIFILSMYLIIKENNFSIYKSKFFKFFFIFWVYIVIVSLFAVESLISLKSSFFYFRFCLYTLSIVYLLNSFENKLKIIYPIYAATLIFLILDSSIQIFLGIDFFGITPNDSALRRISGPFGDKQVLGSFLQKILPVYIYLILKNYEEIKKIKFLDLSIIILSMSLIFRSGDRSAMGLILLYSLIFFMINKTLRKQIIIAGISFIFLSTILVIQNPAFKKRIFADTIGQFKGQYYENFLSEKENETKLNFMIFSFIHQTHYTTAFRMFLDKPLMGHGNKMFRFKCKDFQFKPKGVYKNTFGKLTKKGYGCSTHPHNTYMQFLAETGIIGFLFIFAVLILVTKKLYKFYKSNKGLIPESSLLIGIFINLWPLIPTGNFFNNWLSMLYFVPVAYYFYETKFKYKS